MSFVSERTVWAIKVVIEATREQADAAVEAIAGALCPDHGHPGYCSVLWPTVLCRLDDLDPEDRAAWSDSFAVDREGARQHRGGGDLTDRAGCAVCRRYNGDRLRAVSPARRDPAAPPLGGTARRRVSPGISDCPPGTSEGCVLRIRTER